MKKEAPSSSSGCFFSWGLVSPLAGAGGAGDRQGGADGRPVHYRGRLNRATRPDDTVVATAGMPNLRLSGNAALSKQTNQFRTLREAVLPQAFAGSDVAGLRTTAVLDASGENYIVNGTKKWITGVLNGLSSCCALRHTALEGIACGSIFAPQFFQTSNLAPTEAVMSCRDLPVSHSVRFRSKSSKDRDKKPWSGAFARCNPTHARHTGCFGP